MLFFNEILRFCNKTTITHGGKCLWSTENWVSCSLIAFSSCYQCRTSICHYYFYLLFVFWIIPSMWNFDGHGGVKITLSLSIIYWRHGWSSVHVYRNCRCLRSVYRTFVCSKGKKVFTRIQVNNRRVQVWAFRNQLIICTLQHTTMNNPSQIFLIY